MVDEMVQLLRRVHVVPVRKNTDGEMHAIGPFKRLGEHVPRTPCDIMEDFADRSREAKEIITAVHAGSEHDLFVFEEFECPIDVAGRQGRYVGSQNHHAPGAQIEAAAGGSVHAFAQIAEDLREKDPTRPGKIGEFGFRPGWIEGHAAPVGVSCLRGVHGIQNECAVDRRRLFWRVAGMETGLDRAGYGVPGEDDEIGAHGCLR